MSVLLCLLSALVEVHSQTVPYISFMGTNLPNHSYVNLTLVGDAMDGSDSVHCHTDLSTCCNNATGPHRGGLRQTTRQFEIGVLSPSKKLE